MPPTQISDLVDDGGHLRADTFRLGVDIIRRSTVRQQVAAEITAQFELFRATSLPLDHVSGHKHFHIHPTVAASVLSIGRRYGMRALRARTCRGSGADRTGNGFLERHDALGANFEDPRAASGAAHARCRVWPPLVWGDDGDTVTGPARPASARSHRDLHASCRGGQIRRLCNRLPL